MSEETALQTTGTTAVGPAMSQDELDELFGAAGPIRPKLSFAKMDRKEGVINIPGPDGTPMPISVLENAVICFVQKGRIEWDPDAPPNSGIHVCRSADGIHPAPTASDNNPCKFPVGQLCATCPDGKWGPKPKNPRSKSEREAWLPKCGESKSLLLRMSFAEGGGFTAPDEQGDLVFLVLRVDGTALKNLDEFLSRNFVNAIPRRPYWDRFVEIWLEEITDEQDYTYYVPRFALKGETPEFVRNDGKAAFQTYKALMASNGFDEAVEAGIDPAAPATSATATPTATAEPGKTVVVEATVSAPPAETATQGKRPSKASF